MLQKLGNEFDILREIPIADIEKEGIQSGSGIET